MRTPFLNMNSVIKDLTVRDIRFPTSLEQAGSDAMVGKNIKALNGCLYQIPQETPMVSRGDNFVPNSGHHF